MNEPLRPFTLGEVLDRTGQLYRRNFLLFAGVGAVPTATLLAVFVPFVAIWVALMRTTKGSTPQTGLIALLVIALVLLIPIAITATVVSQAALTKAAISANNGEKLKVRAALGSVWPRFWRYLWLMTLQAALAFFIPSAFASAMVFALIRLATWAGGTAAVASSVLGFILVGLAAFVYIIWRFLGYAMAMPACMVEETTAWNSLKRSVKLGRGTRGRIFVMFLLIWALSIVVSIIGYIPLVIATVIAAAMGKGAEHATAMIVIAEILNVLIHFAAQALITPIYSTALVLFYFDQRVRTEGYDIEMMMQRAGMTIPATVPASSADPETFGPASFPDTVKE